MGRQCCPNGHRHSYGGGAAAESNQAGPLPVSPARGLGKIIPGLLAPTGITQGQQVGRAWTTRGRGWKGAPMEQECSKREKTAGEQGPQPVCIHGCLGRKRQAGGGGPGCALLMFWPWCPGSFGSQEGPPGSHAWTFFVPGSLASDPLANSRSWAGEAWSWETESGPVLPAFLSCPEAWWAPPREGVGQAACAPTGEPLLEAGCFSLPAALSKTVTLPASRAEPPWTSPQVRSERRCACVLGPPHAHTCRQLSCPYPERSPDDLGKAGERVEKSET